MKRIKISNDDYVFLYPRPWIFNTPCAWVKGCPEDVECSLCDAYDVGEMTAHHAESWWYSYELMYGRMVVSSVLS